MRKKRLTACYYRAIATSCLKPNVHGYFWQPILAYTIQSIDRLEN